MSRPEEEGFLARWSRLKRDPSRAAPSPDPVAPESAPVDRAALPPIHDLTPDSDFTPFLRDGVPADLRRQALRKLWSGSAVFAQPDPFDLHSLDCTAPDGSAVIATVYRIGQGMVDAAAGDPPPLADGMRNIHSEITGIDDSVADS